MLAVEYIFQHWTLNSNVNAVESVTDQQFEKAAGQWRDDSDPYSRVLPIWKHATNQSSPSGGTA